MAALNKPYPLFSIIQWWVDLFDADWDREPAPPPVICGKGRTALPLPPRNEKGSRSSGPFFVGSFAPGLSIFGPEPHI